MKNIFAAVILALAIVGCDEPKNTTKVSGGWNNPSVYVTTVEHDSHKFVVVTSFSADGGVSTLHHPDCSCRKADKVELSR